MASSPRTRGHVHMDSVSSASSSSSGILRNAGARSPSVPTLAGSPSPSASPNGLQKPFYPVVVTTSVVDGSGGRHVNTGRDSSSSLENGGRASAASNVNASTSNHGSFVAPPRGPSRSATSMSRKTGSSREKVSRRIIPSKAGSWTHEMVSLAVAFCLLGAVIGILAWFDQRSLPTWPYAITLNALIALLATLTNASLALPISSAISQMKWVRYRTGAWPLYDMEVFDEASRGTTGAAAMLFRRRGGWSAYSGALITILALGLNPLSQQVVTFRTRPAVVPSAVANNTRVEKYTAALPSNTAGEGFIPILPLKNAVYNGLFAENGKPWLGLPVACSTGNCTWPPFETLGICNRCVDMTAYMTRYCGPASGTPSGNGAAAGGDGTSVAGDACGWQLPDGALLNTSAQVFSMTPFFNTPSSASKAAAAPDMAYSTLMRLVFMGTESQSGQPGVLQPWARQCTLEYCVQALQSSVVDGALVETVLSTAINATIPSSALGSSPDPQPIAITSVGIPANASAGTNGTSPSVYVLGAPVNMALRAWFAKLFRAGGASRDTGYINASSINPADGSLVVNLTVGISSGPTYFDTDIVQAFYWNYYEYASGIDLLMSDLATSMTVSMRAFPWSSTTVTGVAVASEGYVHVRWGFIALPVAVVPLTALFLAWAVWRSRRTGTPAWKGSVLATLVHGLDADTRGRLVDDLPEGADESAKSLLEAQRLEAKALRVKLEDGEAGAGLLRASDWY